MHVLFFIHSLSLGGAERVTALLADFWARKGMAVTIVTMADRQKDFYVMIPDVSRISLNLERNSTSARDAVKNNLARIKALRDILKERKPDVAIGMMPTANVILALAALKTKIVTIGSERIYPPTLPIGKFWHLLRRWSYGLLDVIVVQTRLSARWIQTNTFARKIAVIPNPVVYPIPVYHPIIDPAVVGNFKKRIIAAGRLTYQKGFDLLLQAFHQISRHHPDWKLIILGEGELRQELEAMVSYLGLEGRVFLPGRVGNVGEWFASGEIFVLSSRFEGFPNVLLEAMASGLAVISFDCDTGPREIIRHQINGLLVKPGDTYGLAEAINELIENEELRRELSKNARAVQDEFSVGRIAEKWEQEWRQIGEYVRARVP